MFGFTGTPILTVNSSNRGNPLLRTTAQVFGDKLHTYTIVNAINDGNVLPFRIDYVDTMKRKDDVSDKQVEAIDTESALNSHKRIENVVTYILDHFNQKTKRYMYYTYKGRRINGFNSLFAVSSIPVAKKYYLEFKKQIKEKNQRFVVGTIFSFTPNEEVPDEGFLDDESFDTEKLDKTSREFLDDVIFDYNETFKTNFDSSTDGFQNYYEDISKRLKNQEIDLVIVVNMFLTGFDATTLNTLWVDKNLRQHGLIQAFSRTNRILNSVKAFGNIVCFRDLQKETNEAIALFGDENASGIVLLKSYDDYYHGYTDKNNEHKKGYVEILNEFTTKYPIGKPISGELNKKDYIALFGSILRLRNILYSFDDFKGNEILSPRDFQDYTSIYNDLYLELGPRGKNKDAIIDDVIFEMELVKQIEVNIDYILMLVAEYHKSNCKDKEILVSIDKAVKSSLELRSKKDLIDQFISSINANTNVTEDWSKFVEEQKEADINALIEEENLKPELTRKFIENSLQDGIVKTTGMDINNLLPAMSLFGGGNRAEKKRIVTDKLLNLFDKFFGLS